MKLYIITLLTTTFLATTPTFAAHKECDPTDLECICDIKEIKKAELLNFKIKILNADLHKCTLVPAENSDGSLSAVTKEDPEEDDNDNDDNDNSNDDNNGHGNDDDRNDDSNPGNGGSSDDNDNDCNDDSNPGNGGSSDDNDD